MPSEHALRPDKPTLSVIIISYNTRDMTLDCLRALYATWVICQPKCG